MIVDGVRIDSEDEALSLVRKQLAEGTVWLHKHDQGNLDGLTRAVRESGDRLPAFANAILQLLSDRKLSIRTGAVLVYVGRTTKPDDARSIAFLREALKGAHAREVASSLARVDADWICDHATLVPREVLGAMLLSLPTPAHRERLVRALAPWPDSERDLVLEKQFWDMLKMDTEEVKKLKEIVGGTPHSPPHEG